MIASHILSIVTFLPLAGVGIVMALNGDAASVARNARWVALLTTLVEFAISLFIWFKFDGSIAAFQFVERANWLGPGIGYHMGVDGISMLFIVLTAGLMIFPALTLGPVASRDLARNPYEHVVRFRGVMGTR